MAVTEQMKELEETLIIRNRKGVIMWKVRDYQQEGWMASGPLINLIMGKHIDIVVSNAAANPTLDHILAIEESSLDKLWEINVKALILLLKDVAPYLCKGSFVILISSVAGYQPGQSMSMYAVTKMALLGLTKALAAEMSPNTNVNYIAPRFVPSHLLRSDPIRNVIKNQILFNKLGTTSDMGAAAVFLASDNTSY
ncbi:unnamed protein product [Spirodela intermedia]|uniref:Uncharacterized protein n=1 Tax=Spirodela intermedia TaxID=51605 RepID=A0A7I8LC88_SPIIN|nr:unnamed protein product [Spirodela intermedia]